MNKPITRILKINTIFIFTSISIFLFLFGSSPTKGYELSLYEGIPTIGLFLFIITILVCIAISIPKKFTISKESRIYLNIGILMIVASIAIFLMLPFIKGYAFYGRADALTHLGNIKEIIITGSIFSQNIYPAAHVLTSEFSIISGIDASTSMCFLLALSYIFFTLFTYILVKLLFKQSQISPYHIILTIPILSTFLVLFTPQGISLIFIPLIFYFYIKRIYVNNVQIVVIMLIIGIFITYLHPLTTLLVIIGLFLCEIIRRILTSQKEDPNYEKFIWGMPTLLLILFFLWITNHIWFWEFNVRQLVQWFSGLSSSSGIESAVGLFNIVSNMGENPYLIFIRIYGINIVYLVLFLVSLFLLVYIALIRKSNEYNKLLIIAGLPILIVGVTIYQTFSTSLYLNPTRGISIFMACTPIFVIFIFIYINNIIPRRSHPRRNGIKNTKTNLVRTLFAIFSSIIIIVSILTLFPSPIVFQPNHQATMMEFNGFNWYIYNKDTEYLSSNTWMTNPLRFTYSLLGPSEYINRVDLQDYYPMPDHLGYLNHSNVSENYKENVYLVLSKADMLIYETLWPAYDKLNANDLKRLELDITSNNILSNDEFNLYFIVVD